MELCGFKIGWRRREGERFERYSSVKRPVLVNTIWNGSRSNLYLGGGKDEEYPVGLLQWAFQSPGAEQHLISSFCISSAVPDYHNRLHCNGIHRKVQERRMKLCQRHNGPRLLTLYLELHPDPLIGPQVYLRSIKILMLSLHLPLLFVIIMSRSHYLSQSIPKSTILGSISVLLW